MEQTLSTAKRLLVGLNEIHPNICVHGLNDEFEKICEMKEDLAKLVSILVSHTAVGIPEVKNIAQGMKSRRLDVISSFEKVLRLAPVAVELATDKELHILSIAAENFTKVWQKYLSGEENLKKYAGSGAAHKTFYENGNMGGPDGC